MTAEPHVLHRARAAARAAFLVTGVVAASWAGRLPAVQDHLDLGPGGLAVAVLGVEAGALFGLPVGGALVARRGSRAGLALGLAGYAPLLPVAAAAPSLPWLTGGLAVWAAANSVVDVALNAQGVELERCCRRPVLSGLHAAQGLGLLVGALGATAAAAAGVPLGVHLGVVALGSLLVGGAAIRLLLPERTPSRRSGRGGSWRGLLGLGAVAACAFCVDASATQWVAVHLRADHGAGPGLAAAGVLVVTAALVVGRLPGDRLLLRYRRATVVRGCGLAVAAGAGLTACAPTTAAALVGWTLVGLAVAPLAPVVLGAAPDTGPAERPTEGSPLPSVPAPVAIATVTTVGYLGSATGAPAVGALAEAVGLSAALLLLSAAGAAAALLAGTVPARR